MTEYNPNNYVFFWGTFLSNFYPAKFVIEDVTYNCSEQCFMKKKQETFDKENKELADLIMQETNPNKIKQLGRKVKNFNEETWINVRYNIMKRCVYEKFNQNKDLKKLLLDTENKILVEASPYDKIWGIGLNTENAKKNHPSKWKGLNLLGKILMDVRDELKSKSVSSK